MTLPAHTVGFWGRTKVGIAVFAAAVLLTSCAGSSAGSQVSTTAGGGGDRLVIAEPAHSLGYLPLYVGIREGLFADEGLAVSTVTLQGGGAHTNAVLTGEAWAFIGGPEHNAFAAARDNAVVIKAVANIVNRGNVYLVARPGLEYGGDLGTFLEGKTIVTGAVGSTPSSITQYLLSEYDLEAGHDVKVIESADPSAMLAIMQQGQADIAVTSEPVLGQGVAEGIWQEPFYNVPQELGPYAYSTINVRQDTIDENPETVQAFVRAMVASLRLVESDPELALEVAHAEFPTLDESILQETIDRSLEDELWEFSGRVTPEAVETALSVVRAAGVMDDAGDPVQYDEIVDMSFIDAVEG